MDAHKKPTSDAEGQAEPIEADSSSRYQTISRPVIGLAPNRAKSESGESANASDSNEDLLSPNMDGGDAYRRRRAQLMAEGGNQIPSSKQRRWKGQREEPEIEAEDSQHSVKDSQGSDFSSMSTSDDVELDHLESENMISDDEEIGLTNHNKRHHKRDTDLDAHIGGSFRATKIEQKDADRNVLRALLLNSLLVVSWYLFSLSISIYNKWMFTPKYLDFHFPLFTTSVHMVVQFCLASLVLYFVPRLRPRIDSISNPHDYSHIRRDAPPSDKPLMTHAFYLTRISPCGAATGLDIGLGNMSLKLISLTFYTMCKSSSLAFVLTFAFLFRLETPSVKLVAIIMTMTIGVIMMVAGEVDFNTLGFILVILAAFFSGFRWSLTQILLLKSPATSNPFSSIFFLAPVMFLSLAVIAIPVEGFTELGDGLNKLMEAKGPFLGISILLFPGLLAFLMTASEFALLQRTSVVTLSICGIFKEVVTISAAGIVFHDPLTPINVSGLVVTIASIGAYNYMKITKMRKDARLEVEDRQMYLRGESDADEEETESMLAVPKPTEDRTSPQRPFDEHIKASSQEAAPKTLRDIA